jgi:hypothetical protein
VARYLLFGPLAGRPRESVHGSNTCVRRVTRDGYPGLVRSRDCAAQCCGKNFLRFCPRRFGSCLAAVQAGHPCPVVRRRAAHPAARRKPVICRPGKSRSTYTSRPVFHAPSYDQESVLSRASDACDERYSVLRKTNLAPLLARTAMIDTRHCVIVCHKDVATDRRALRSGSGRVRPDAFSTRLNVASNRPNDTTRMWWLGRSVGRSRSVAVGVTSLGRRRGASTRKCEQLNQTKNTSPLTGRRLTGTVR